MNQPHLSLPTTRAPTSPRTIISTSKNRILHRAKALYASPPPFWLSENSWEHLIASTQGHQNWPTASSKGQKGHKRSRRLTNCISIRDTKPDGLWRSAVVLVLHRYCQCIRRGVTSNNTSAMHLYGAILHERREWEYSSPGCRSYQWLYFQKSLPCNMAEWSTSDEQDTQQQ